MFDSLLAILRDVGLLFIRLMVGWVFVFHGAQKLFGIWGGAGMAGFAAGLESMGIPYPTMSAWLAALAEFGGGLALMLGLATRLTVIPLVVTMAVAAFVAHGHAFSLQEKGMEYALTLGVVSLGLGLTGAGRFSFDGVWSRRAGKKHRAAASPPQT